MIAAAPILVPVLVYLPLLMMSSIDLEDLTGESAEAFTPIKFAMATFFAYVGGTGLVALFSRWLVSPREPAATPTATNSAAPPQYAVLQGRFATEMRSRPE